jgi:hypothetical protein
MQIHQKIYFNFFLCFSLNSSYENLMEYKNLKHFEFFKLLF